MQRESAERTGTKREKMDYEEDNRRPRRQDNQPIHTEKLESDRKKFFLDLKENDRGQFVKITEDVRGRRDTIMVPIEVLDDFIDALHDIRDAPISKTTTSRSFQKYCLHAQHDRLRPWRSHRRPMENQR